MTDLTINRTAAVPQQLATYAARFLQSAAANWRRARRAQQLAETYLYMSDEALLAHGTTREAVTASIGSVFTDAD